MEFSFGYQLTDIEHTFFDWVEPYLQSIEEIYFPWIYMPSGRTALGKKGGITDYTAQERLIYDLRLFKREGIKLDLLFNSSCYGSDAISLQLENDICSVVDYLEGAVGGVEIVTTTSPAIAFVIKKNYPHIRTRASINMRIGTIAGMKYLADVFDEYNVQREYNRDLLHLKRLKKWADDNGKRLYLLANSGCLSFCSGQTFHDNMVAHEEEIAQKVKIKEYGLEFGKPGSRSMYTCWNYLSDKNNLPDILKASWIRPEDLHRYEELFSVIKLASRIHIAPAIVLKAYSEGKWRGNLADLLEPGFSSLIEPYIIDNTMFPQDWFDTVTTCGRNCGECRYCDELFPKLLNRQGNSELI
jgi:collagenase-like PrtC family protease